MASGIQENNGGPVGYGQPNRGMRRRLLRPEDEQFAGMSPERQDVREDPTLGQGQPPHVYPPQPQGVPQGYGQYRNQSMPGRAPMQYSGGENQYAQQSYQTRTDDPFIAGIRNQMATPMDAGGPPAWQQRNGGFNPPRPDRPYQGQPQIIPSYQPPQLPGQQRPGTSGPVDPRYATPESGYGWGGVNNPQYQNPQGPLPGPQLGGDLAAATRQSIQNNYTDIAGMRDVFKPGDFMGQLEGFNTNSWGTGERGSDTLKNMFGTIASNYDVTQPGALRRALPDILKALPEATIVEHANEDLLDPDGPGPMQPVDVIRSAGPGGAGAAWQWGPVGGGQAPQGPQGPSSMMYNQAMTQGLPQAQNVGPDGVPQVQDENSAMQFLQWLMQQQQQGMLGQPPQQPFV